MDDDRIDTSDIPPLDDDFFKKAEMGTPSSKEKLILSVDTEIVDWFRRQGIADETHINKALREYMQTHCHE
ncbi:MAG: BrnA antitoxin family protein [Candidatus Omnitrophica bacterium]|nr:BrnA antitoxin family protein [Candidatus Omnitrophota bacterium]